MNPLDPIAADLTSIADVAHFPTPMHLVTHSPTDALGNFGKREIERSAYSLVDFMARANNATGGWYTFSLSGYIFYLISERQQGGDDPDTLLYGLFGGAWLDTDGHSQVHEFKHSLLVSCPNGRFAVTRYFLECCMGN
ncbi:MAG: hypothetical protein RLZZ347_405 [Candidatus Parcubacteria bacterium]|jgi:hypothetical protein